MPYDLMLVDANNNFERIRLIDNVKEITWTDDIEKVFTTLTFETSNRINIRSELVDEHFECGNWVELLDRTTGDTALYAVIVDVTRNALQNYKYLCFDLGYYLDRNKVTRQFDDETVFRAIINVCDDIRLPIGNIFPVDSTINFIYRNMTASNILRDIYQKAVDNRLEDIYHFDCKNGRVNFRQYERNDDLRGFIAQAYQNNSLDMITGFSISENISDLKNAVRVYSDNKKENPRQLGEHVDEDSVTRYGYLREIEELKFEEGRNYDDYARTRVGILNQPKEEITFTVIGDYHMRKGVFTLIENDKLDINGLYKITASRHEIIGTEEKVTIDLVRYIQ